MPGIIARGRKARKAKQQKEARAKKKCILQRQQRAAAFARRASIEAQIAPIQRTIQKKPAMQKKPTMQKKTAILKKTSASVPSMPPLVALCY